MSGAGEQRELGPSRVEVLFLDAGGVLLFPDWPRVSSILARHGITATSGQLAAAELIAKRRMDDAGFRTTAGDRTEPDGYLGWVVKAAGLGYEADALHRAAEDFGAEHLRANLWSSMPPEVLPLLDRLRAAGLRLGLISNTEENIRPVLKKTGLAARFETLVLSAEVGIEKPDAGIFHVALERMSVAPERSAFVGDLYSVDVLGARRAGILPILLDSAGLSADRDCLRVRTLGEVADLLGA